MKRRLLNILIALDQLVFSLITLGHSSPDETISAGAYRMEIQRKVMGFVLRPVIDTLFWFDPDHCRKAYISEFRRIQLPKSYQDQ